MTLTEPRTKAKDSPMVSFSLVMKQSQRDFLEKYRRQQGLYSMADACRELLYIGSLSVDAD